MEDRGWSFRGCACCDGSTLSLSGATLNRRNFIRGMTAATTMAAVGVGNAQPAAAQTAGATKP
jgi:hypothetical protein